VPSRSRFLALAAVVLLALPSPSFAQKRDAARARQVVERVLAAEASGDWKTLVALSDPRSVEWFRRWHLGLARLDRSSDNTGMLRYLFGIESAAQLEALPADSILGRFLRAVNSPPDDGQLAPAPRRTIIGEVLEGDTAAHFVIRTRIGPVPRTPDESSAMDELAMQEWLDILSLRRTPAGWRTWLTPSLMSSRRIAARRDTASR
jgi:hypothetical protein